VLVCHAGHLARWACHAGWSVALEQVPACLHARQTKRRLAAPGLYHSARVLGRMLVCLAR